MNFNCIVQVFLLGMAALSVGCASVGVIKERVEPIKKVAIIGYEVEEQKAPILAAPQPKYGMPASMLTMPPRETKVAAELYKNLSDVLTKELHWQVVDMSKVATNEAYHDTQQKISKLLMFNHGRKADWEAYLAQGIIPAKEFDSMDSRTKEALRRALGVDAIVVVENDVEMRKKASLMNLVGGSGSIPVSTVHFSVYDMKDDKAVWWDHKAEGDEVAEKTMQLGGISLNASGEDLDRGPVVASEDAYRVLIARFREAMNETKT